MIVVFLFFRHDARYRLESLWVNRLELPLLLHQVLQHHAFDGEGGGRDGGGAQQAGHQPQRPATDTAQHVAAAATDTAKLKRIQEQSAVPPFVFEKMPKYRRHVRCRPARHQDLCAIDVDGAVLARVIDLQDPIAQKRAQPRLSTIS